MNNLIKSNMLQNSSKEEIKICARLNGLGGLGIAAGYMVFDSSMPEFEEIKLAFIQASQKYLARVGGDIEKHETEIYKQLKQKFGR